MAITKQTTTQLDNVTERGQIHVKTITRFVEDGTVQSESIHRKVLNPGDSLTGEAEQVVAVANAVWTPEVVAAWLAGNPAPVIDWRIEARNALEIMVAKILSILSSMQVDYTQGGFPDFAQCVYDVKQQVKAIDTAPGVVAAVLAQPGSRADFDAAVTARWLAIVTPCPAQVKADYKKYGGNTV